MSNVLGGQKRVSRSPGTEVIDSWELNLGPLEKQPVLLTAEPSLQPYIWTFLSKQSFVIEGHVTVQEW